MRAEMVLTHLGVALGLTLSLATHAEAQTGPPSLVNVTEARFGTGCPSPADPTGSRDSTCAVRAALTWTEGHGLPGAGFPVLYFPHGIYKLAGEGYTSALTLTKVVSLQGDGASSTVIQNTSPKAALLTYLNAEGCSNKPGICPITVQGITFAGSGHATSGGLIEIDSSNTGSMRNVVIANTGGIGLNLQGSSERWYFSDMEISNARWPVVVEGDTNEDYFNRVNVIDGGQSSDYCYSVNCPGGKLMPQGIWRPDPHSAVFLDGDNVHWMNSSIKSTSAIGGIRLATITGSLTHTYIEGFPWGGQPRANHSIAAPGKAELGHITSPISQSALEIPVDDPGWQPLYVNDPSQARVNGRHAYVNFYGIFPADYLQNSKEPSRAVPGITRGTSEMVLVGAFSGDGQAHLISRGKQPVAWPAGSILEQAPPNGYGAIRIEENHLNSLDPDWSAKYPSGCNDTEQLKQWTSSPSELCAEVIAGLVPDGYMVPFPSTDYVHQDFNLHIVDDSIGTGGSEADGQGWIKIAGNAIVRIDQGNEPLRGFVDMATALHSYSNGNTRVQVVTYPGTARGAALGYVVDESAGVRFSPQNGYYAADVIRDGAVQHQETGHPCWYGTAAGNAAPGAGNCITGSTMQASPASPGNAAPLRYVMRDWQVNLLAPRGEAGDCKSREADTGSVKLSTAGDATLVVNLTPNPGAMVAATGTVEGDGKVAVRLCNTGSAPVRWSDPVMVTLTQVP